MQISVVKMEEKQSKSKLKETTTKMPYSLVRTVHQNIEKNSHNRKEQLKDYGIIHIQNYSSGKMMYNYEKNPKMSINPIKTSHSRKRNESPFIRTIYQQCSNQNINEFKSANIKVDHTSNIVQKTKYYGENNPASFVVKSDKTSGLFENESDLRPVDFSSPKLTKRTLNLHTRNSKEKQPSSWSKSKRNLDGCFKEIQQLSHVVSNNVDLSTDCYSECANSVREGISCLDKRDFRKTENSEEYGMRRVSTNSSITTRINVRDGSCSSRREHHEIHDNDDDRERRWNHERFASDTLEKLSTEPCIDFSKEIGKHANVQDTNRRELKDDRTESQNLHAREESMDDPLNKRFGSASAILARVKRLELKYNFRTSTDFDNGDSNKDLKINKDGIRDRDLQEGISSNDEKNENNNHKSKKSANCDCKNEQQNHVTGSYEDLRLKSDMIMKIPHYSSDEDLRYHKKRNLVSNGVHIAKENQNGAFLNSNPLACSNEHKSNEKSTVKDPDVKLIHENKFNSNNEITLDSKNSLDNPRFCSQQETIQCPHEAESIQTENHCEGAVRNVEQLVHNHNHDVEKMMHNPNHDYDVCENDGKTEVQRKMEDNLTDMEDKGIDMTHSKAVSTLKEQFEHLHSKGHSYSKIRKLTLMSSSSSTSEDSDSKEAKKDGMKMFKFGKLKSMFENPDGRFMQLINESDYDNEKSFSYGKTKENRCNGDGDVEDATARTEENRRKSENTEDLTIIDENSPTNVVASTAKNTNSLMDLQFKITQVKICSSPKTLRRKFDFNSQTQEATNKLPKERPKEQEQIEGFGNAKLRDENGNNDELVIQVSPSSAGLNKPEKENIKSPYEEGISSEETASLTTQKNVEVHDADIDVSKGNIDKQNLDMMHDNLDIVERRLDSSRNCDEKNDKVILVDENSVKDDETKHFDVTKLNKPTENFKVNTEERRKDALLEDVHEREWNMIGNHLDSPDIQICISSFDSIEDSINKCIDTLNSRTSKYNTVPDVNLPELLKAVANEDANEGTVTYKNGMHYGPYISYSRKANDMKDHAAELGLYTNCLKEKNRICEELLTSRTVIKHHTEESKLPVGKIVSKKNTESSSIPLFTENHPLNIAKITPYNTQDDLLYTQPFSRFTESLFKNDCLDIDINTLKKPSEEEDLTEHSSEEKFADELKSQALINSSDEFQELNVSLRLLTSNQRQQIIPLGIVKVNKMENLENKALDLFMKHLETIDEAECLQIDRNDIKFLDITKNASNTEIPTEKSSNVNEHSNDQERKCFIDLKGCDEFCMAQLAYQTLIPKKTLEKYLAILIDCHSLVFFGTCGIGKTYLGRTIAAELDKRLKDKHKLASTETLFYSNVNEVLLNEIIRTIKHKENIESKTILIIAGFDPILLKMENWDSFLSKKRTSVYIIATCAVSRKIDTNSLLTNHNSRNVWLSTNEEPVKGLLKRYLRRKFITSSGSLDDKHSAVIEWLNELWQNINKIIESYSSLQKTIGPSIFFSCPENSNEIEEWFIDVWNYSLVPYIEYSIKDGCQYTYDSSILSETFEWIMQTYLWKEEKSNLLHKMRTLNIKKFGLKELLHENSHKTLTKDTTSLVKYILRLQRCIEESKNSTFKKGKEQRRMYLESAL